MASIRKPSAFRGLSLEGLGGDAPWFWLGVLALCSAWLRVPVAGWVFYPIHLALTLLLGALVLSEGGWLPALRRCGWLVALGTYIALVAALRGQWLVALTALGVTLLQAVWGVAAYRLGESPRQGRMLQEALVLLLAASVAMGLLAWGVQALWPPACRVLPCRAGELWPYAFRGGWSSPAQYVLFLVFVLPAVAEPLILLHRQGRFDRQYRVLLGLAIAAGLGVLAGGLAWSLLVAALGIGLLARVLLPSGRASDERLVIGLGVALVFGVVVLYGLFPGYLSRLTSGAPGPVLRVTLADHPGRLLSSEQGATLALRVVNTGWGTLEGSAQHPARLGIRMLVQPDRGNERVLDDAAVSLPGPLAPGAVRSVQLPVRPPHWVHEGFLTWQVHDGQGHAVPLARSSDPGYRFLNPAYRRLDRDPDNRLTALMERTRAFAQQTHPPQPSRPDPDSLFMVTGDVLDTLFFSPFWGEAAALRAHPFPFAAPRPFFLALLHQYGLIGLLLAGAVLVRLYRRLGDLAFLGERGGARLAWVLTPVSLTLLFAAGWFTPELGSYHALWAFFLLAGWIEGRHARAFPRVIARPKARRPSGGGLRGLWPLTRFRPGRRRTVPSRLRRR